MLNRQVFQPPCQPTRHPVCGLVAAAGQQDRKLFTAQTRHAVAPFAYRAFQLIRHFFQADISCLVTIMVVEAFKVIDVHHDHRQFSAGLAGFMDGVIQLLLKIAPVGNAG